MKKKSGHINMHKDPLHRAVGVCNKSQVAAVTAQAV